MIGMLFSFIVSVILAFWCAIIFDRMIRAKEYTPLLANILILLTIEICFRIL